MNLFFIVLLLWTSTHELSNDQATQGLNIDQQEGAIDCVIENGKETNQTMLRTEYDRHFISQKKTTIIFILHSPRVSFQNLDGNQIGCNKSFFCLLGGENVLYFLVHILHLQVFYRCAPNGQSM